MSDTVMGLIYNEIKHILPTHRHLAPEGTKRPYMVINSLPAPILRCFNPDESIEQMRFQITLWYDWNQDDSEGQHDACAVSQALDLKSLGGIIFRQVGTPGFYVNDAGKGRRALQVVLDYIYERTRVFDCVTSTTSDE